MSYKLTKIFYTVGLFTGISVFTIGAAILLLTIWTSNPQPISYVIVKISTDMSLTEKCEGYKELTILKQPGTANIIYQCGNLGRTNELVTFYKSR